MDRTQSRYTNFLTVADPLPVMKPTINVKAILRMTRQSYQKVLVTDGDEVTFHCNARSRIADVSLPITYTLMRRTWTAEMQVVSTVNSTSDVSFSYKNFTANDTGQYYCVAENLAGEKISDVVYVAATSDIAYFGVSRVDADDKWTNVSNNETTVLPIPITILNLTVPSVAQEGTFVILSCSVKSGFLDIKLSLDAAFENRSSVENFGACRTAFTPMGQRSKSVRVNVTRWHNGMIVECSALHNGKIVRRENRTLNITYEPKIEIALPGSVMKGDSVVVECKVVSDGNPPVKHASFVHYRPDMTNERILANQGLSVRINSTSTADIGLYKCFVDRQNDRISSNMAQLDVKFAPWTNASLSIINITVDLYGDALYIVDPRIGANPAILSKYCQRRTIRFDGSMDRGELVIRMPAAPSVLHTYLTLLQISAEDLSYFGGYECIITNSIGNLRLLVDVQPRGPSASTCLGIKTSSVAAEVIIVAGFDGGHEQSIQLQYRKQLAQTTWSRTSEIDDPGFQKSTKYVIKNLQPNSAYDVQIVVTSSHFSGEVFSPVCSFETKGVPRILNITASRTGSRVRISWSKMIGSFAGWRVMTCTSSDHAQRCSQQTDVDFDHPYELRFEYSGDFEKVFYRLELTDDWGFVVYTSVALTPYHNNEGHFIITMAGLASGFFVLLLVFMAIVFCLCKGSQQKKSKKRKQHDTNSHNSFFLDDLMWEESLRRAVKSHKSSDHQLPGLGDNSPPFHHNSVFLNGIE
ncbi:uncharacterized protein LOC141906983 [Tubulanus polymorphus]|uniref:uncharacterized protein LOC141906983 n=1 Tax=Tubulanus polymorphus TaxID=672921 RepID=UPI003DA5DE52